MSDTDNKNSNKQSTEDATEEAFQAAGVDTDSFDEPIDEELLALSAPPPSVQHTVFILIIIGFSFLVLFLFWPELKYFMKGFAEPESMGEVSDMKADSLTSDSFVEVEGVPLVNRTVTFSTGTKWFSGDVFRKMAPVSGNPNLLVQWHTHNPEIKQAKDSMTPPSYFAGRLKKRTELSENYNKFWPFYDCLKLHNTSQCKFCIGKKDLDECRPIFTCVDNYPIEVCDLTAFNTEEDVQEKIEKLKSDLDTRASADLAAELEANEKALTAFENIHVLADFVLLEELFDRVELLQIPENAAVKSFALQKKMFELQVKALEIRLQKPIEKIDALSSALKTRLLQNQKAFAGGQQKIETLEARKEAMSPLVDVNAELVDFVTEIKEQKEKLRRLEDKSDSLKEWTLTGEETGAELLAKVRDLSALLASMKLTPKEKAQNAADAAAEETDTDATNTDTDDSNADIDSTSAVETVEATAEETSETPATTSASATTGEELSESKVIPLEDPVLAAVDGHLDGAVERIAQLGRKFILLAPGDVPELDKWARNTDIVGSLPKPLRADHVFKSFEKLLEMVKPFEPKQTDSLKSRYRRVVKELAAEQQKVGELGAASGLAELALVQQFERLQQKVKASTNKEALREAVSAWQALSGAYAQKEFCPWDLSNYPSEKEALVALVKQSGLPQLEVEVAALEQKYASPMYVLLDDEKPTDNPWILFIYLVVPIMLVINFRKLLRFIADWRQ